MILKVKNLCESFKREWALYRVCVSERVCAFRPVAYLVYLSEILAKGVKNLFPKSCIPWKCQRSAVTFFTLFNNSWIHNITINIYAIISIAFLVFTVYIQLWEILIAPCIIKMLISLHFISPERIYVCEYVKVTTDGSCFGSIQATLILVPSKGTSKWN